MQSVASSNHKLPSQQRIASKPQPTHLAPPAETTRNFQLVFGQCGARGLDRLATTAGRRHQTASIAGLGRLQETNPSTIRVATFNIHGGCGLDGKLDIERTAECLRDLDFVGLNEVHGNCCGIRPNQAEALGRKLGMAWLFVPTERRWWHDHFGNGVLTRISLTSQQQVLLPATQKKYRNLLLTGFRHSGKTIHVVATHIDTGRDRDRQLKTVIELFLSLTEPAILIGDLNSNADDPQLAQLLQTPGVRDAVAEGLRQKVPPRRIDWIITRGLQCVLSQYRKTAASDHPILWAELQLSTGQQG